MKAQVILRQQFMEAFQEVDVLVSATVPYPAPKHTDLTAPFASAQDLWNTPLAAATPIKT